jgi:hypothetical protein
MKYKVIFKHDDLPSITGEICAVPLEMLNTIVASHQPNIEPLDVIVLEDGRMFWVLIYGFTEIFEV